MKKNIGITMQIIFTISLYLMQSLLFILSAIPNDIHDRVMNGFSSAFFYLAIGNLLMGLIMLCIAIRNVFQDVKNPAKVTMVTKILLIPYYVINLFLWFMVDAMISFIMFPLGVILTIFGIVITYCYMLTTSLNNISYVLHGLKSKQLKPNALIIFALIGMFSFCLDVVGSIIIYIETKNINHKEPVLT